MNYNFKGVQLGDIGFAHNTDFVDRMIRWAEGRKYGKHSGEAFFNHSFIIVDDLGNLVEAVSKGVVETNIGGYAGQEFAIYRPPYASPDNAMRAATSAVGLSSMKYGFFTDVSLALMFLTGTKLRFGRSGTEICSGLVSYCLTRAGIDVASETGGDENYNSPADLMHYVIKGGWQEVMHIRPTANVQTISGG
jgi:hypothetical protein